MAIDIGDLIWFKSTTYDHNDRPHSRWWPGVVIDITDDGFEIQTRAGRKTKSVPHVYVRPRDASKGDLDRPERRPFP